MNVHRFILSQVYIGGHECPPYLSSFSGKELASVYQAEREPQYIFRAGLIPGSPSRLPAGTMTTLPLFDNQGNDDPHWVQNEVAKYFVSGGSYRPT